MPALTTSLAQLIGLSLLIVGLAFISQRRTIITIVNELLAHRPLVFVVGVASLVAGLAIVLNYDYWSSGLAPLVITLLGWLLVVRGVIALFASQGLIRSLLNFIDVEGKLYLYAWVVVIIGAYLCYVGFIAAPAW